jgi:hypothetical protein
MTCHHLACPRCHLPVPRALIETEPLFVSIIGVPASGKSYFLTAMTWELRRLLATHFGLAFSDVDTVSNRSLNEYEETLFLQGDPNRLVAIRKTELQGELYDQIRLGQQIISLPRPFMFCLKPAQGGPNDQRLSRIVCLYDNAGEHFQPGMDTASSPVTQHMAQSRVLMFLYDPTQDPRFRELCRGVSNDPQLRDTARAQRQETILTEAALRVRRFLGLPPGKKHDRPLIVIVPKLDAWEPLLQAPVNAEPITPSAPASKLHHVDLAAIEAISTRVRKLLLQITPEFVSAAEDFCSHVLYVPVTALGHPPELDATTGMMGVRPKNIRPKWVTVPFLYMFAKWSSGLISANQPARLEVPRVAQRTSDPASSSRAH